VGEVIALFATRHLSNCVLPHVFSVLCQLLDYVIAHVVDGFRML
jgi:hypothetical protein